MKASIIAIRQIKLVRPEEATLQQAWLEDLESVEMNDLSLAVQLTREGSYRRAENHLLWISAWHNEDMMFKGLPSL
jgi:hypothetical protein